MEIREVHTPNDGHDPFPVLIGRQRMPIDRNNVPGKKSIFLSKNELYREFAYSTSARLSMTVFKLSTLVLKSFKAKTF